MRCMHESSLIDNFGRKVDYLRLSITDRCDFRCLYCMSEDMQFLPRREVLSLEEIVRLSESFVELGIRKIRITGGEPLIRKDAIHLIRELGQLKHLEELCLTTNGSHLTEYAQDLFEAGVDRINISVDSTDAKRFKALTRIGNLHKVIEGVDACRKLPFKKIKINAVLMRNYNFDEILPLAHFALDRGLDISFIEEMPLGEISSHSRAQEFVSSKFIRETLAQDFALTPSSVVSAGPSRYWDIAGYDNKIGFISPHSENFCASCNRVRVTASGRLLLCLGNEHSLDLKSILRKNEGNHQLKDAIIDAMRIKPEKHEFNLQEAPQILRFMNATGG